MRLAVLIPVFNAGTGLQRTLGSLASDTVPFDVVLVDDGSSLPVTVSERVGDHRVVVLRHHRNRGVAHALNTGLAWIIERGYDAVARLDAGDQNEPGRLGAQVSYLVRHHDVAIVGGWTRHVDEQMKPLYTTRYPDSWAGIQRCFHYRSPFSHPACVIRTDVLRRVGGYDPGYLLGEDYELFWRLASQYPCANIPEVLVTRVESPRSLTRSMRFIAARTRLLLQWRHFSWRRMDCWLGLCRSMGLLCVPGPALLMLKRAVGTIG